MNQNKLLLAALGVLALLAVGLLFGGERAPVVPIVTEKVPDELISLLRELQQTRSETFGAVSGPEISGNAFTVGGVTQYFDSQGFGHATNTACVFFSPSASSTLKSLNIAYSGTTSLSIAKVRVATSTATTTTDVGFGVSTTTKETDILNSYPVDGKQKWAVSLTPTTTVLFNSVFDPRTLLFVELDGGTTTQIDNTGGRCSVNWQGF